ncbi:MAG: hypothetical protein DDT19_03018 [Syntrophomonadaceae bacterium]|nr:hypothetical protein [Bacillota bacterium]
MVRSNDEFPELNLGSDDEYSAANDDSMVLNLDRINEDSPAFELLPAGLYDAIIENTEFGNSKSSGNPQISWTFSIIDHRFLNRKMFYYTVLNKESGLARLKRLLIRVIPDADLKKFHPSRFCEEGVALGRACRIKVRISTRKNRDSGQSEPSNVVTDVLAALDEQDSYLGEIE